MSRPIDNLNTSIERQYDLIDQASACFEAKDYEKARTISDQLLAVAPQSYDALHLAGSIAEAQDRLPEAAEFLKRALSIAPDPLRAGVSWWVLGKALRKAEDLRQAEEAFRRAIRMNPNVCVYHVDLAESYSASWKVELTLETLQAAIRRFPTDPLPAAALGNHMVAWGRYEDARIAYELALKHKPDFANAYMSLGGVLKTLGKFEEAAASMREALRLEPDLKGYTELVQIAKPSLSDEEVRAVKKRLEPESNASLLARVDALFTLANIYDKQGDYAASFKNLDEGCRLYRPSLVGTMVGNSIAEHEKMVDGITAMFSPDFISYYQGMSKSELAPIFIVGMPRSGTTLTEQILASHSKVRPGNELRFMTMISREVGTIWQGRGDAAPGDDATVARDINQAAERYAHLTAPLWKGKPHITDKMPMNFFYVGMIHLLFPKAKIIYVRRNPAATCFSCLQNLFAHGNLQFSYDQVELGREYNLHVRMMAHWDKVLP